MNPTSGQLYFTHTDRLGTPQKLTDSSQTVAWSALYQPFGGATLSGPLTTQSLRLPGQQFDPETGLHHNGFRDYAPGLTRYVESDPIGIQGGINTYGYVAGNPTTNTDSSGLVPNPAEGACVLGPNPVCLGGVGVDVATWVIGIGAGAWVENQASNWWDSIMQSKALPPEYWDAPSGAAEWGKRNGIGADAGRRRFHEVKKGCPDSKPTDRYGVNPDTGDVVDPDGEIVGNLGDEGDQ